MEIILPSLEEMNIISSSQCKMLMNHTEDGDLMESLSTMIIDNQINLATPNLIQKLSQILMKFQIPCLTDLDLKSVLEFCLTKSLQSELCKKWLIEFWEKQSEIIENETRKEIQANLQTIIKQILSINLTEVVKTDGYWEIEMNQAKEANDKERVEEIEAMIEEDIQTLSWELEEQVENLKQVSQISINQWLERVLQEQAQIAQAQIQTMSQTMQITPTQQIQPLVEQGKKIMQNLPLTTSQTMNYLVEFLIQDSKDKSILAKMSQILLKTPLTQKFIMSLAKSQILTEPMKAEIRELAKNNPQIKITALE